MPGVYSAIPHRERPIQVSLLPESGHVTRMEQEEDRTDYLGATDEYNGCLYPIMR